MKSKLMDISSIIANAEAQIIMNKHEWEILKRLWRKRTSNCVKGTRFGSLQLKLLLSVLGNRATAKIRNWNSVVLLGDVVKYIIPILCLFLTACAPKAEQAVRQDNFKYDLAYTRQAEETLATEQGVVPSLD